MRIDIRKYQPSKEMAHIINTLYEQEVEIEKVRQDVYGYKCDILSRNYWKNDSEVEQYAGLGIKVEEHVITDPEHIFLLSPENLKRFKALCFREAVRRGYEVKTIEDCPLMQCDTRRAELRDRLVCRLIDELEEQRLMSLRNLRAVSNRAYTDHIENIITDLLEEAGRRRKLREARAEEIRQGKTPERRAL